ncbi:MAG: ABC-ATPase UvrA [Candidatus Magasanikbacteria bacterium RIFCSPHIGHO2_01_FULL_41_23]|uniref:UvrABC system protein A n=1 Tax=Candidatus Magasanikbacteria bacterium RIFCSPLOWO2_01_FULL_40_15 TaxID=1798686 RepID=A0A1F6N173_9BACT|nr:MAG: ABC-ATPase UvrA [Candidatus Magasanikbacteria bacterium RIFCSPHIGHO2_01_FULL_41_23]OGH74688.1 MAG: ABC-ATPase UvrA [Candidatus Magasanikbacteria bacterium RIFCSPHIGHO2_12_FULL_41_16]OGH77403.1 MAG: ABC-ATPase UvrA [Candidatus Magasanikbacteria bacterium RIFCSPLOWO2_01_FULL_40_15]
MQEKIIIRGAREHNLKNISLELPRNQMIVFTGLSGSGKSSLAFDTIFAEGQRRYIESLSAYARQFLGGMQKPDVDEIEGLSPAISIDQKAHSANPRSTVATITEIYDYLRVLYARIGHPFCPLCGTEIAKMSVDEMMEKINAGIKNHQANNQKNIGEELLIFAPVVRGRKGEYYQMLYDFYNSGFVEVRVDGKITSLRERITLTKNFKHTIEVVVDRIPSVILQDDASAENIQRLNEAVESAVQLSNGLCTVQFPDKTEQIYSTEYSCPSDGYSFPEIEPRLFSFNSPYGYCASCTGLGVKEIFSEEICAVCAGKRLNANALNVKIAGKNIWEVTTMTIADAREFFALIELELPEKEVAIATAVFREISNRLQFMFDVGLHYLTLGRRAGTLSGGEAQRIRLASQVGTKLVGALYVLDEPTIGLHQRDNARLVSTLRNLCDVGNTIIVVEHDEDTILASDWIVDIGPGAGKHGGEIVFSGPREMLLNKKFIQRQDLPVITVQGSTDKSLTGRYLRRELRVALPESRRKVDSSTPKIKIKGAREHNLKNITVEIPLRRFVCLTGVSGSGKSTLMHNILHRAISNKLNWTRYVVGAHDAITGLEYIDKIVVIDQAPIGRTPRSNPATYTKAFDYIREIFAATPEAKMRGYKVGRFSFNRPGGRCENCEGKGTIEIEMHFLPSVEIVCEICRGKRFTQETLQVKYNGKNISEILEMTVEDAEKFFTDVHYIADKLKMLNAVGLEYLTLGQSATTLSGGEAQRIKLSKELAKRGTTKTLYLLDEPTTGLHYDDVRKLIDVLQKLASQGNTVMVIEHNLDVIKSADWIIDLGPEGGDKGGMIVATGTPEEVARKSGSATGEYLRRSV